MAHPKDANDQNSANPLGLCARAVTEAWDFCIQSALHVDKRSRQVEVVSHGLVVGGIKDIPNELLNNGWQTAGKAAFAGAIGAGIGIAINSKIKWLAFGAKSVGLALGGSAIAATTIDLSSKPKLQAALSNVWKSTDEKTMLASKVIAETECGPEGFNWGLSLPSSMLGAMGGNAGMKWLNAKFTQPRTTMPAILENVCETALCNKIEQNVLVELNQYLETELPGSSIRWARRDSAYENGLNVLVDLPADISMAAPEVFRLRLLVETLNDSLNCDVNLRTFLEKGHRVEEFGSELKIDFLNSKPAR